MAKQYTEEQDEVLALNQFQSALRNADKSFNSKPFPSNESGDLAFVKCADPQSAQAYCPERWKAMQLWINNTFEVSKLYHSLTHFYVHCYVYFEKLVKNGLA